MEKKLASILQILIGLISAISFLSFFNQKWFEILIKEDGILENLTAAVLLVSSVSLIIRFVKIGSDQHFFWKVFNTFMILGLFFVFGEEISWGQRIFEIEPSDFFSRNNTQNETNLHNLTINGVKINRIISVCASSIFGVYYLFLLRMYKKVPFLKKWIQTTGIPVPTFFQSLWFLGGTLLILSVPHSKKWEIWECVFVLSFLWILIAPHNKEEKLFTSQKEVDR